MSTPPTPKSGAFATAHGPIRTLPAVRRQSRLAQWYPIWRLVSGLCTLALGIFLPIGGYWWGLVFVVLGLTTLILTRMGQRWRELTPGQKSAALPGLLIGTAIEILIAVECVILLVWGIFGSGSKQRR